MYHIYIYYVIHILYYICYVCYIICNILLRVVAALWRWIGSLYIYFGPRDLLGGCCEQCKQQVLARGSVGWQSSRNSQNCSGAEPPH